jgi:TctA family transporter
MTEIDPGRLAAQVRALHGYELDPAGAARAAQAIAGVAAAIAALAAQPQFHEEPANLALTLSGLAPEDE